MPAQIYERIKLLLTNEPFSEKDERKRLQDIGAFAGWDDPIMDIYDDLDPRRQ